MARGRTTVLPEAMARIKNGGPGQSAGPGQMGGPPPMERPMEPPMAPLPGPGSPPSPGGEESVIDVLLEMLKSKGIDPMGPASQLSNIRGRGAGMGGSAPPGPQPPMGMGPPPPAGMGGPMPGARG